ncbi:hypothetical protein GSI_09228 [Ganoderma sinense ZZ0214-1]|uniref:Uncharacterized protein n=1 Tax=Ganoderma sinense ZZ0214-1 TaxID=1077348 RepID=A0A2G8S5W7_9APHY|nr:hypothetical protein GSI_09228 [Ganoderma sinense ZZ0214-1]
MHQCLWIEDILRVVFDYVDEHEYKACAVARANGFRYLWIDSCCIDKSSSSELSEAINSMYLWYAGAAVCYAYLADVPAEEDPHAEGSWFRDSRWFTRGWTLQELIAPSNLVFLSQDWAILGSKHTLVSLIEGVTGIDGRALLHLESLDKFSVSQRFSWASRRETTRVEDQAYSLLGLFDIHMPIVYGEGKRAFRHLQEQIMQRIPDQSLFAWGSIDLELLPGVVAPSEEGPKCNTTAMAHTPMSMRWKMTLDRGLKKSPSLFASDVSMFGIQSRSIQAVITSNAHLQEYRTTPHGIRTQFPMIPLSQWFPPNSVYNYSGWYLRANTKITLGIS